MWSFVTSYELETYLSSSLYTGGDFPCSQPAVRFTRKRKWRLAVTHAWKYKDHINVLEAAALLLAL